MQFYLASTTDCNREAQVPYCSFNREAIITHSFFGVKITGAVGVRN